MEMKEDGGKSLLILIHANPCNLWLFFSLTESGLASGWLGSGPRHSAAGQGLPSRPKEAWPWWPERAAARFD